MSALPPLPPMRKPTRSIPSWPVWVLFVVMLIPGMIVLALLGFNKDIAQMGFEFQRDAVGRSVVVTGTLSEVDTTSGLPMTTSYYEVVVPDADGGPDKTVTFTGGEQWGFPPSSEYPAEQSFLVITDDPPHSVRNGPVGSIDPVTEATLQDAEHGLTIARAVWVAGIVIFWIFAAGLPILGTVLAVRRHRKRPGLVPRI
ncbi:hypothetical protein SAMN06295879_2193 [Agreia bicolorata]|uniref:Uncharacterized protein n=1 Tax=Agreia bicolorata TaxID=110935 RepID=A0A1T4Y3H6_9MICO|nr:hypothetical protein [Agreia bicolorata]SKA96300.1 hypothetical protein SAMN06295879_2193 [Agreia bicolorata]